MLLNNKLLTIYYKKLKTIVKTVLFSIGIVNENV